MSNAAAWHGIDGTDRLHRAIAAGRRHFGPRGVNRLIATRLAISAGVVTIGLAACSAPDPIPVTPPGERAGAAVVRKPVIPPVPALVEAPALAAVATPPPAIVIPAGSQYVCVTETEGVQTQTAIAFAPKVAQLCLRHPEMGPCQYERNLCRRSGGRVYAAGGEEITLATEAEYDEHVLRVRFKSN